ncbi:MgtC/SapB family protein [Trueperella pyogenes]
MSGIGFLGTGVIFVNNDAVRGLTTTATVRLSAALGWHAGR